MSNKMRNIIVPVTLMTAALTTTMNAAPAGSLRRESTRGYRAQSADTRPSQQTSEYQFFDVRVDGGHMVQIIEINDNRVAVGAYADDQGAQHTFLWSNGQVIRVPDHPGSPTTSVASIDNQGRLFGNWGTDTEQTAGYYVLTSGQWVAFPPYRGYPLNFGSRITDSGRAVGGSCSGGTFNNPEGCVGWIWNGTEYEVADIPGSVNVSLYGINDPGEAVGIWFDGSGVLHGVDITKTGTQRELSTTDIYGNAVPFAGYDVGNQGAILGSAPIDPNDFWLSSILYKGKATVLPKYPGVLRTFYQGMNARGDLVGTWFNDPNASDFFGLVALTK